MFDPQAWKHAQFWSVSRGLTYWRNGDDERILFGTHSDYLFSLDAATGLPDSTFGVDGRVDLGVGLSRPLDDRPWYSSTSPPIICRDVVVIGSYINDYHYGPAPEFMLPGDVRGYDVRTGELLWTFRSPPQEGEVGVETWGDDSWKRYGGGNTWAVMSADEELGYVYLPTSNPSLDQYGGGRPGDNLFSNSLVCLNARTGKRVWHFQILHHGLWNYDLPTAPILLDITVDGKPIKAVAQLTKQAMCFVFDRTNGEPVWPIVERPVPASTIPEEHASPTQPFPTRPAPYDRQGLTVDDLIDFTPALRQQALEIVEEHDLGPLYTPPSERGAMVLPGDMSGSNWVGGALHPDTGWLYPPSLTLPAKATVRKIADDEDAHDAYEAYGVNFVHGPDGLPLTKPPYGRITAIDMNTGDHVWQVPVGKGPARHPALRELDLPPLGGATVRHVLTTPTLLFVTSEPATQWISYRQRYYVDPEVVLRAYDLDDGRLVAEVELPDSPFGTPMTYVVRDRQYIGMAIGNRNRAPEFVALAIPRPKEQLPPQGYLRDDAEHSSYYAAVEAIDTGDTGELRELLATHPELARARGYLDSLYEHDDLRGATLLHLMAGNPMRAELHAGATEMTAMLLESGADPEAATISGATALTLMIDARQPKWLGVDTELIEQLLDGGADPNARRGYALWRAVRADNDTLLASLLEAGGHLDLGLAAALNRVEEMERFVVEDGSLTDAADGVYRPGVSDSDPWTEQEILTAALSLAARKNSIEAARWLLDRGADVNLQVAGLHWERDEGSTPLHQASWPGHIEMIRLLLEHGADPTLEDVRWKELPRTWADDDQVEVVNLLKEAEARWKESAE